MLVLARRLDEKVRIGHDIEVMVVEIHSGYVRLGITAPEDVPVHREEVHQAIDAERRDIENSHNEGGSND